MYNKYPLPLIVLYILLFLLSCNALDTIKPPEKRTALLSKLSKIDKNNSDTHKNLFNKANKLITKKFRPITEKKILPPSGNKHDYFSTAVYYWQNPDTKDGLPWIYKDGKYNGSALKKTDHSNYYNTLEAIRDLSFAFKLNRNIKYARKAINLINMWFIDEKTIMNPHLEFAQGIPGKTDGFASGIIDSRAILWVINSLPILEESGYWTEKMNTSFKKWCSNFLDWLINSEFGIKESKSKNNHGTFYDLQVATFATYVENYELAIKTLENMKEKRIEIQILPDGSMPEELKRTRAFMYSSFNLSAFFHSAILAEQYEINLWNYKTDNCGSIKDAFDFVINNSILKNNWNYKGKINKSRIISLLQIAGEYLDPSYLEIKNAVQKKNKINSITDYYYVN